MLSRWVVRRWREFRASWRDTVLLLREFHQPLLLFALAMLGSGWLYFMLSRLAGSPVNSLTESIYLMLTMTFLQASAAFPSAWYLQIFFFVMPVIGISILAQGLADFGYLLFNRKLRGKEWEMAVASTFSNHTVLVGLGHLGYKVVKQLYDLGQDVVIIELNPKPDLLANVQVLGVPVISDDGSRDSVLTAAGVPRARAIVLCTQDDSLNLQMALKARNLNPKIEVIIRIFDDDFASSLQKQFGFRALSATGLAAPLFAALAVNVDITPPISIEGTPHILARMQVLEHSQIRGLSVREVEERFKVSVVLLCENGGVQFHPTGEAVIQSGQEVAIFGQPERINRIMHEKHW